ncbi:MAG: carboxypeptidase regulatory-like domain-containing protein, partial [Bryobacterales bacterium]|nr:carboxypeptidase regulatory-like domain-containing protein [Bryobacterales bacterium]
MALFAQVLPVGTVDGTIKDPTGALLVNAKVTLKNVDTGVSRDTLSNEAGYFFFPLVQPGNYEVSVEKSGFKQSAQRVSVRTGIRTTADFSMELGQVTESVEVSAQAALLETSTSAVSRNVQQRVISDMPLLARNVLMLANLAPGITNNSSTGSSNGLIDIDNVSYTSASGSNNRANEFLMDGIPNNVSDRVAYIPSVDDVQEFTIQTNALDAEYGHGGGMFVNMTTKGGTNELHGSLWDFFRNDKLNANQFFANKAGRKADGSPVSPRPVMRWNQYGLTAGGPVIKDKLFWFFNFEGIRQRTPTTYRFTVPTALQRTGDFSQSFDSAGRLMQIADPWTTAADGTRTLFPGNKVPANRIDPIAAKVIPRYPTANLAGDPNSGVNNYFTQVPAPYDGENYSVRIDPNIKNHRLFVRWSHNQGFPGVPTPWDIGGGVGQLEGNNRAQTSVGLSDALTLSPTMVITGQIGYTRWTQEGTHPSFDQTTLGFPSSLVNLMQQRIFPNIGNSDMYYIGASEGQWYEHTNTLSYNIGATKIAGSHAIKFGFQSQVKQNNSVGANRPGGQYSFNRGFTQPNAFVSGSNQGNGIASFLLGTPDGSGNTGVNYLSLRAATAPQAPFYGWYFQDDYKVTPKLTLNLGLRYDLILGITERYNRNTFGFDPRPASPISVAAKAAYALNPIPELAASSFNVNGGLFFATPEKRRNSVSDKSNIQPRLGLAYRVLPRTVIRTGFGMFFSGWWQPFVNTTGFASQTEMLTSLDGGLTPANTLSNPYPSGLVQPTGSSQGLATLIGSGLSVYDYWPRNLRNFRWSFGVQHEITPGFQVEVNYVGQHADHLVLATSGGDSNRVISGGTGNGTGGTFNQKYYSLGSRLNAKAPNPFFGLIPASAGALGASTITVGNLLQPYPQFQTITILRDMGTALYNSQGGTSDYNSLQVSAIKRMSYGLDVQAAYTFSKQLEQLHYVEPSDPTPTRMTGAFDNPQRLSAGIMYELPFGEGKSWRTDIAAVDKIIGGWQWSTMYIYQTGAAVNLPAAIATGTSPSLSGRSIDHWFNGAALKVMPAFTARSNPYYWGNLRVPAINN